MKQQVSKGTVAIVCAVALVAVVWFGWRMLGPSAGAAQQSEETAFREAEKKAKANGIDIRTLPQWAPIYYKYHPEETPPAGVAAGPSGAPTTTLPPGVAGASPSANPPGPPTMNMPPGMAPGGR